LCSLLVESGTGQGPSPRDLRPIRKKRNSLEVTADMLDAALKGARKTAIMYRANLSYELLNRYLERLVTKKLLFDRDDLGFFWVSPRGVRFLREFGNYEKSRSAYLRKAKAINEFLE